MKKSQNVRTKSAFTPIINWFFIFRIVYGKIYKYLIKFIKNYRYTYINGIFIINFEYI